MFKFELEATVRKTVQWVGLGLGRQPPGVSPTGKIRGKREGNFYSEGSLEIGSRISRYYAHRLTKYLKGMLAAEHGY